MAIRNKMKERDSIGVLGSGLMGHGIAYTAALSGFEVLMLDITKEKAKKGLEKIYQILEKDFERGLIIKQVLHDTKSRIKISEDYKDLGTKNFIIEAIYEDLDIKSEALKTAEKFIKPDGIIASNTSTIPISILASKIKNSERFIGIHFFSPVHKMKLVEIIKANSTSFSTLEKALNFTKAITKTPIVVNDSPGFYTTRVFTKYPCEGMAMLDEGIKATSIENAGKKAGYPVGPLALSDEVNIALVGKIREQILKYDDNSSIGPWDKVIDQMVSKFNRVGKSQNGGFYEYPLGEKKYIWESIESHFPVSVNQIPEKDIIERLVFAQVLEAIHCYQDNIITSFKDANTGSILGLGFPKSSGGVLEYVNSYGPQNFNERCLELAKKYGKRFHPPKLLVQMAKTNTLFI